MMNYQPAPYDPNRVALFRWQADLGRTAELSTIPDGLAFIDSDSKSATVVGYQRRRVPLSPPMKINRRAVYQDVPTVTVRADEPKEYGAQLRIPFDGWALTVAGDTADRVGGFGLCMETKSGHTALFADSGPQYSSDQGHREDFSDMAAGARVFLACARKHGPFPAALAGLAVGLFRSGLRSGVRSLVSKS